MSLHLTQVRGPDSDAIQVLEGVLAGRNEVRLGWVRDGHKWKFTYLPLSLSDFAELVVALRAAARCAQLAKPQALRSRIIRGTDSSLEKGGLLFRGCSAILVLGGPDGSNDVVLPDMASYQDCGSYIVCLRGSCNLGTTSLTRGNMAFAQPHALPPTLSFVGDTSVALCLLEREVILNDVSLGVALQKRFSKALSTAERARANKLLRAWRQTQGKGAVKKRPSCHAGVSSTSPPKRRLDGVDNPSPIDDGVLASSTPAVVHNPSPVGDLASQKPAVVANPVGGVVLAPLVDEERSWKQVLSKKSQTWDEGRRFDELDFPIARSARCQTLHRVVSEIPVRRDLFLESLASFSPEYEQVVWHLGDFALAHAISNVVLRDATPILSVIERREGYRRSDVVLSLVKMRILHRYGGWMCDPDVLWMGRAWEVLDIATPSAVVASVATRGRTTITECFMGGAQYAECWRLCERKVQAILRSGKVFVGLSECIREVHAAAPMAVVILEPSEFCSIAPEWRLASGSDAALGHLVGCAVKVWPEWPKDFARAVIARSSTVRSATRATPIARERSDVVELVCETRAIIRSVQHSLECVVGDIASALEWMCLGLKQLDSLSREVLVMSLPWGPRFLTCAVMELACGWATFGSPSEFGVAAPYPNFTPVRASLLANASYERFSEYKSAFLSTLVARTA